MDFDKLKIVEGQYWDAFVHPDQTALGRTYLWYKGEAADFLDIPKEALLEFHGLGNKVKSALTKLFKPDLFNYLSLNNITKHLHVHIIPRYSRKINYLGLTFEDISFGRNYKSNPEFKVAEDVLVKIRDKLATELKN